MSSFVGIPLIFLRLFLNSNIYINIHEYKDNIDCIFDRYEKERVKALMRHQVCFFWAISN